MENGFITFWSHYFQGNDKLTEKPVKELDNLKAKF